MRFFTIIAAISLAASLFFNPAQTLQASQVNCWILFGCWFVCQITLDLQTQRLKERK